MRRRQGEKGARDDGEEPERAIMGRGSLEARECGARGDEREPGGRRGSGWKSVAGGQCIRSSKQQQERDEGANKERRSSPPRPSAQRRRTFEFGELRIDALHEG